MENKRVRMPYFANNLVEHYESDVEPKLFPDKYTQYIEKPAYDELLNQMKDVLIENQSLKTRIEDAEISNRALRSRVDFLMSALIKIDYPAALDVIRKWKAFWMNQTQNSKEDRSNYFNRAFGVDSNMMHHLADLISEEFGYHDK